MRTAFNRFFVRADSRDVNEAFRIPLLLFPQTSSVEAMVGMDDLASVLDGWMTDDITQPSACQPLFQVLPPLFLTVFPPSFQLPPPSWRGWSRRIPFPTTTCMWLQMRWSTLWSGPKQKRFDFLAFTAKHQTRLTRHTPTKLGTEGRRRGKCY